MNKKIKYGLPGLIFSLIISFSLFLSSFSLSASNQKVEAFESTSYDYLISDFLNNEKVSELLAHEAIKDSSRFYNFSTPINGGKKGNVLLGLDHQSLNLSFFNEKLLLEGEYSSEGILVDDRFASAYNLSLGDQMRFSLNGQQIIRPVSGIFVHSIVSTFSNGIAITPWFENYEDLFDIDLTVDLVFVSLNENTTFGQFLQRNQLSSLSRAVLLLDINQITRIEYSSLYTFLSIFIFINILGFVIIMYRNFMGDQKEISVNIKEKNLKNNLVYNKTIQNSFALSYLIYFISAIGTLITIPFLKNFYILFLLTTLYFLSTYLISKVFIETIVNKKPIKKQFVNEKR
jgi:hypothetical protein